MNKHKIFIDGKAGTTGLQIYERLKKRNDIELILLSDEERKNIDARKSALNNCDIAFLCLPDEASIQAVSLITNPNVKVIDASTAHRTNHDWVYGIPELSDLQREKIKNSKRVCVPGCHASGFITLLYPLIQNGLVRKSQNVFCYSITGYSGAGKEKIAEYEDVARHASLSAPMPYALTQNHKHLKEMQKVLDLDIPPIFCPVISDFYSGMVVTVPIFKNDLQNEGNIDKIKSIYHLYYNGPVIQYEDSDNENNIISSNALSGKDSMQIFAFGNEERILLAARYDNLGKGASGAAVQCMNIILGLPETKGLIL